VLAATKVGPGGKVVSVEPGTETRSLLERNIRLNHLENVRVLPVAAWDADTTLFLNSGEMDNCGAAEVSVGPHADQTSVAVPARRLAPQLSEVGCDRIDVLKIDIEGAELPALRGLEDCFRRAPPRAVYCELLGGPRPSGETAHDLLGFFDKFGYRAWAFSDKGLDSLDRDAIGPDTIINLFLERG
jgi:FkbM family methyltransferase